MLVSDLRLIHHLNHKEMSDTAKAEYFADLPKKEANNSSWKIFDCEMCQVLSHTWFHTPGCAEVIVQARCVVRKFDRVAVGLICINYHQCFIFILL